MNQGEQRSDASDSGILSGAQHLNERREKTMKRIEDYAVALIIAVLVVLTSCGGGSGSHGGGLIPVAHAQAPTNPNAIFSGEYLWRSDGGWTCPGYQNGLAEEVGVGIADGEGHWEQWSWAESASHETNPTPNAGGQAIQSKWTYSINGLTQGLLNMNGITQHYSGQPMGNIGSADSEWGDHAYVFINENGDHVIYITRTQPDANGCNFIWVQDMHR